MEIQIVRFESSKPTPSRSLQPEGKLIVTTVANVKHSIRYGGIDQKVRNGALVNPQLGDGAGVQCVQSLVRGDVDPGSSHFRFRRSKISTAPQRAMLT